jgi:pimeloyl-ACP methyl ester carboxylesterase
MPFATHDGIRIHYEVEGDGAPLLLHHSLMRSLDAWREFGYVAALGPAYQFILIDARGHGASDKPHDPAAYQMEALAGDVLAVLDDLGVRQTLYWGYSLGSIVGFQLARLAPDRFRAFILGGAGPRRPPATGGHSVPSPIRQLLQLGAERGMAAVVALQERAAGPLPAERRASLLASDPHALLAVLTAIETRPDASGGLPAMQTPCLVYAGEADANYTDLKVCAGQMPNATFVGLPGADHPGALSRSDLILPQAQGFLVGVRPA